MNSLAEAYSARKFERFRKPAPLSVHGKSSLPIWPNPVAGPPLKSEDLVSEWRLIWTAFLPVNTLFCVACSRMFNHPNCPVYDAKDPVGRSMSGSQIRAISGNRHRVLPGEELKTSVASQALRHRAPRPKPEGLVSGGGDVLPPPVSSNPLMQDFITKLQRNFRRNSASLERELKQPNEYGGFRLVLR